MSRYHVDTSFAVKKVISVDIHNWVIYYEKPIVLCREASLSVNLHTCITAAH